MQSNEVETGASAGIAEAEPVRYRPYRLGHVNLFVGDYETTCRFLSEICGLEATGLMPDVHSGFFSNGRTHHDIGFIDLPGYHQFKAKRVYKIVEPPSRGETVGLNHFGWEMRTEKDLVDAYERACAAGLAPRITNNGTSYSNYLFDPGGGQHQLYADNELDWRQAYTGGVVDLHRPATWKPGETAPSEEEMFDRNPVLRRHSDKPVSPRGVSHALILTGDMDAAFEFYHDILGLTGELQDGGRRVAYLYPGEGRVAIILVEEPGLSADRIHHAAFELWADDDLDQIAAKLTAAGVPPVTRLTTPYKDSLFILNPDGIYFEFYRPLRAIDDGASEEYRKHGLFGL